MNYYGYCFNPQSVSLTESEYRENPTVSGGYQSLSAHHWHLVKVCIGDTNIHTNDSRILSGIYVFSQKTGQLQKSSAVIELPKIPTYHPKIDYILCIKELNGG